MRHMLASLYIAYETHDAIYTTAIYVREQSDVLSKMTETCRGRMLFLMFPQFGPIAVLKYCGETTTIKEEFQKMIWEQIAILKFIEIYCASLKSNDNKVKSIDKTNFDR